MKTLILLSFLPIVLLLLAMRKFIKTKPAQERKRRGNH